MKVKCDIEILETEWLNTSTNLNPGYLVIYVPVCVCTRVLVWMIHVTIQEPPVPKADTGVCLLCLTGIRSITISYNHINDCKSDNTILTRRTITSNTIIQKCTQVTAHIPHRTGTTLYSTVPYPNTATKRRQSEKRIGCQFYVLVLLSVLSPHHGRRGSEAFPPLLPLTPASRSLPV